RRVALAAALGTERILVVAALSVRVSFVDHDDAIAARLKSLFDRPPDSASIDEDEPGVRALARLWIGQSRPKARQPSPVLDVRDLRELVLLFDAPATRLDEIGLVREGVGRKLHPKPCLSLPKRAQIDVGARGPHAPERGRE